ncbi:MAG: hypothetical protein AB7O49_18460 [Sphingomonadales bacterium]
MRISHLFQRDDHRPGKHILAIGLVSILFVMALATILSLLGLEDASVVWLLLPALPFAIVALPIAFSPMILLVGLATGMSPVATQYAFLYMRLNWRGVIGWILIASCALSLMGLASVLTKAE